MKQDTTSSFPFIIMKCYSTGELMIEMVNRLEELPFGIPFIILETNATITSLHHAIAQLDILQQPVHPIQNRVDAAYARFSTVKK